MRHQGTSVGNQAIHPRQLVGKFVRVDRVTIRQVDRGDAHGTNDGFDVAGLLIGRIAGQRPLFHFNGLLGENRHAIEGFLPGERDVIAGVFNLGAGEPLLRGFQFLEQQNVRAHLSQIRRDVRQPHVDGVHVPRGNLHTGRFRSLIRGKLFNAPRPMSGPCPRPPSAAPTT